MKKSDLIQVLLSELEKKYQLFVHSALEAKEAATNEESKPENKYDTRSLEASYLASAQSSRVEDLKRAIVGIKRLELTSFSELDTIKIGALVQLKTAEGQEKRVFLLPYGGGEKLLLEGEEVVVLTPDSPLGKVLIGKSESDEFEFTVREALVDYEILKVL